MGKILLVEDDFALSSLYEKLLSSEGFEVVKARDIKGGLDILSQEEIVFVLLDVMLIMHNSGLDLLEDIKNNEKTRDIPVVVLTNVAKDEERARALKLGAKEYLVKAAQKPKDVIDVVKKYL